MTKRVIETPTGERTVLAPKVSMKIAFSKLEGMNRATADGLATRERTITKMSERLVEQILNLRESGYQGTIDGDSVRQAVTKAIDSAIDNKRNLLGMKEEVGFFENLINTQSIAFEFQCEEVPASATDAPRFHIVSAALTHNKALSIGHTVNDVIHVGGLYERSTAKPVDEGAADRVERQNLVKQEERREFIQTYADLTGLSRMT